MENHGSARQRKGVDVFRRQGLRRTTRSTPEDDEALDLNENLTYSSAVSARSGALKAQVSDETVAVAVHYPRWVSLLGGLAFVLYAALYVTDGMLFYWTFVPGFYREVLVFIEYAWTSTQNGVPGNVFSPVNILDLPRILRFFAAVWRVTVGQHYVPARTFRYIDRLVTLSLSLEVGALGTALLFLAVRMWFQVQSGAAGGEKRRQWSLFALVRPWTAWAIYRVLHAVLLPDFDLENGKAVALAAPVLAWIFVHFAGKSNAFLAAQIPPSCLWQLALSFHRLSHSLLDPYQHQVAPAIAVTQLALLFDMPFLAWRATGYYRRFLLGQVGRAARAGYSVVAKALRDVADGGVEAPKE